MAMPPRRDYTATPEDNALKPLSGIGALSTSTRELLVKTGLVLDGVPTTDLPVAYLISRSRDTLGDIDDTVDESAAIGNLLSHIERMSKQGVILMHMAHRLSLPVGVLKEAMIFVPEIAASVQGGLAHGADEITRALSDKAIAGDSRAQKLWLEARGGEEWSPKPVQTSVNIGVGRELASVTLTEIERLQANQSHLLLDVDYSELGGS